MPYYQNLVKELEDIRSGIKHLDPADVNLDNIRSVLGSVILDLQVLQNLRRPSAYKLHREGGDTVTVTIEMILEESEAEDMLQKLWLPDSQ